MKQPERYLVEHWHWSGANISIIEESFASKRKARICIRKLAGRMLPGEMIKFLDTQEGTAE